MRCNRHSTAGGKERSGPEVKEEGALWEGGLPLPAKDGILPQPGRVSRND